MSDAGMALRIYTLLIRLYPRDYRQVFGTQMRQTFKDAYADRVRKSGCVGLRFWMEIIGDAVITSTSEHIAVLKERSAMQQIWIRQGIVSGTRYGLLWLVVNVINTVLPASTLLALFSRMLCVLLFFIVMPLFYGRIGMQCGYQSRSVTAGTYAGLVTTITSSAIMLGSLFVVMVLFWPTIQAITVQDAGMLWDFQQYSTTTFAQYLWEKNVHEAVAMAFVSLFYAGSIGTIGGMLGVRLAKLTTSPIHEHQPWSWSTAWSGLAYGMGVGVTVGLVVGVNIGVHGGLAVGLGSVVVGGLFFGLLGGLVGGFTQSADLGMQV
jgi:hypothetical protein